MPTHPITAQALRARFIELMGEPLEATMAAVNRTTPVGSPDAVVVAAMVLFVTARTAGLSDADVAVILRAVGLKGMQA